SENNESDNYREDCHPQENSEKDKEIKSIIESLLFSANEPLSVTKIYFLLKEDFSVNKKYISTTIDFLKNEYDANMRGFEISEVSDGFILKTRKTYHIWIKKLHKERAHDALSKTALETLSIIAYKQPISRGEIEKIRGVNVDGAMKILLEKALICASGRKEVPGKPWLYSTTKNFLMAFGLKNLQELPPLGELSLN
ncbi:MAG: segregation and condensation protein B, partial [uncultured bacterium]